MTPEYLMRLANKADPNELWRVAPELVGGRRLTQAEREQCDTGVALRRYAGHLRDKANALTQGKSLCITPLTRNSSAVMLIETPEHHVQLRENT